MPRSHHFSHSFSGQSRFTLGLMALAFAGMLFGATSADAAPGHRSRHQRSTQRHYPRRHICRSYPCGVCHNGYSYAQRRYDRGHNQGHADGNYYGHRDGYYGRIFYDRPQRLLRRSNRHYRNGYYHGYSRGYHNSFERGRRERNNNYRCR